MPFRKRRVSKVLQNAVVRAAGLESIVPSPVGPEISLAIYQAKIAATQEKFSLYNTRLSEADEARNQYEALENEVKDLSERILALVVSQFGTNSNEYQKAGGTRKSDRRRRRPAADPTTSSEGAV